MWDTTADFFFKTSVLRREFRSRLALYQRSQISVPFLLLLGLVRTLSSTSHRIIKIFQTWKTKSQLIRMVHRVKVNHSKQGRDLEEKKPRVRCDDCVLTIVAWGLRQGQVSEF